MIEVITTNKRTVTPKNLVVKLKKLWKFYRFGRQEDAHEFLVMYLQGILRASFGNSPKLTKKYEHLTMLYRIFAGKLRSQVKWLSCGNCSNSFEPFLALSLDVSKGSTFEEWIRRFCSPEVLDGSNKYQCGGCNRLSKATKRMTFYKPPRILTVQFLRFTITGRKIDKFIKFPKWFNLRVFVSENIDTKLPREKQTDHVYDLYGVIVHAGRGSKSGHYYSFVKKDMKWYRCNDESVTQVHNIDQVLKQKSYLLFYKYRAAKPKVEAKAVAPKEKVPAFPSLALNKTKSISVEIKETHENKNNNTMPLSGFMEVEKEVNSEEEEEKLVQKESEDKNDDEKNRLDYILQNFEDVDFNDYFKDLDMMKNLSVVSLKDENYQTPELKQMISNRLQSLNKQQEKKESPLQDDSNIKVPDLPVRLQRGKNMTDSSSPPLKLKKRDLKYMNKNEEYNSSTWEESNKGDSIMLKSSNNKNSQNKGKNKKKKKKQHKNNLKNDGTNQQFEKLVRKLSNK